MATETHLKMRGGQPAIAETLPESKPERLPLGPLKTIHVFWMAGMSCDGCTITVAGATNPGIEGLLAGTVPAMPKVLLHHPVLSVEAGAQFMQSFKDAHAGTLGDPYVVVFEGSVPDERIAARTGGYWSAMGSELMPGEAEGGKSAMVPTTDPHSGKQLDMTICFLRGVSTGDNAHSSSGYAMLTGVPHAPLNAENVNPGPPNDRPCLGAMVRRLRGDRGALPGAVRLPMHIFNTDSSVWPGQDARFARRRDG